jgi:environmental stress-induced protein Ves
MLLEGNGISLDFENGKLAVLKDQYDYLSFDGSEKLYCKLLEGHTKDFNVMTSQKHMSHKFEVIKNNLPAQIKKPKADILLLFCLSAQMEIEASGQAYILKQYDMLEINKAQDEHININARADLTYAFIDLNFTC